MVRTGSIKPHNYDVPVNYDKNSGIFVLDAIHIVLLRSFLLLLFFNCCFFVVFFIVV